jgi:hypothetical protein
MLHQVRGPYAALTIHNDLNTVDSNIRGIVFKWDQLGSTMGDPTKQKYRILLTATVALWVYMSHFIQMVITRKLLS